MSVFGNLDRAFCLARDCQHYDSCARAMPDDIGDNLVWTMDHCEEYKTTEPEK